MLLICGSIIRLRVSLIYLPRVLHPRSPPCEKFDSWGVRDLAASSTLLARSATQITFYIKHQFAPTDVFSSVLRGYLFTYVSHYWVNGFVESASSAVDSNSYLWGRVTKKIKLNVFSIFGQYVFTPVQKLCRFYICRRKVDNMQ